MLKLALRIRRSVTRTLSFFSQWMAEVLRQPWLMVSLVLGPFLILLLFGAGETVGAPKPRTILVLLQGQSQQDLLAIAPKELSQYLQIVGTTASSEEAQALLRAGKADLVVVAPTDPATAIGQGKHAQIQVFTDEIDPVRVSYANAYVRDQVAALNQQAIQKSVAGAQSSVGDVRGFVQQAQNYVQLLQSSQGDLARSRDELRQLRALLDPLAVSMDSLASAAQNSPLLALPGLAQPISQLRQLVASIDSLKGMVDQLDNQLSAAGAGSPLPTPDDLAKIKANLAQIDQLASEFKAVPADVISAPFALSMKNVAPFVPTPIGFYAPAVLALLLQHLAVTLGALSMARVRLLGLMELFQTSPVKPAEVATGNYLAYGVLCAVAGALLVALLVLALGVPIFGSPLAFAAMLVLLIFCSLGMGFVISMISSSEQQAAQIAMLVLIASVFFSGFLVSIDTITWPVRAVSYALPATYAIRTLQDVMLRGVLHTPNDFAVLGGVGIVLFVLTVLLFKREFRPR